MIVCICIYIYIQISTINHIFQSIPDGSRCFNLLPVQEQLAITSAKKEAFRAQAGPISSRCFFRPRFWGTGKWRELKITLKWFICIINIDNIYIYIHRNMGVRDFRTDFPWFSGLLRYLPARWVTSKWFYRGFSRLSAVGLGEKIPTGTFQHLVCLGVPQAIPLLWMIYYIVHGSMDHFLISGWVFLGVWKWGRGRCGKRSLFQHLFQPWDFETGSRFSDKPISNLFQTYFRPISNLFQTYFKPISNLFQTYFKPISTSSSSSSSSSSISSISSIGHQIYSQDLFFFVWQDVGRPTFQAQRLEKEFKKGRGAQLSWMWKLNLS